LTLARQFQVVVLSSKRRKDSNIIGKSVPVRHKEVSASLTGRKWLIFSRRIYDLLTILCHDGYSATFSGGIHQIQLKGNFMSRKKKVTTDTTDDNAGPATAIAEPAAPAAEEQVRPEARQWANPYKAIFVSKEKGFEMGENRRFGQRVFLFNEKPSDEVLAALKENGFTYRAGEKAWTIQANALTRKLSDDLAREFGGQSVGMSR
jgi:hypothetical protein